MKDSTYISILENRQRPIPLRNSGIPAFYYITMSLSPSRNSQKSIKYVSQPEKKSEPETEYPNTQKAIVIMAAVYLAIFLTTLVLPFSTFP